MDAYKKINLDKDTVYIAGPMTGQEDLNFSRFDEVAHRFKERGYRVINPAQIARNCSAVLRIDIEDLVPREIAHADLEQLISTATHMHMLEGWELSAGAKAEHAIAEWFGMIITYEVEQSKKIAEHHNKEWWFTYQAQIFNDIRSLTKKKNDDYTGGASTSNPFANFDEAEDFGVDPLLGLSLRMGDKMQRLKSYCNEGLSLETEGDTLADIFKDLIGYSSIALGMLERRKEVD
jgi:hypothetical protein